MSDLVSIIIPTYKRPESLQRAIGDLLKQTYHPIEIIVVDDNGEGTEMQKKTQASIQSHIDSKKISYIKHKVNKNGSAARNTGLRHSKGKYICFLDDDDEYFPETIKLQVQRLEDTGGNIGATYCNFIIRTIGRYSHIKDYVWKNSEEGNLCVNYLLGKIQFNTSCILFKRESLIRLNGFDESFKRHQDFEILVRFFRYYEIVCTSPESLVIHDLTQARTDDLTPEKLYNLEKKFLSTFSDDFEKLNAKNKIEYISWRRALLFCLEKGNFEYFKKVYKEMRLCGINSYSEKILLFKSLIKCLGHKIVII